jgi:hypothetical protein
MQTAWVFAGMIHAKGLPVPIALRELISDQQNSAQQDVRNRP